jgi:tripartite ATP-independent transporter DctM subunit
MLIPPSVLMIVWGVLTEQSIGKLFLAGVLPGFLLASLFAVYVFSVALIQPARVGAGRTEASGSGDVVRGAAPAGAELWRMLGSTLLVVGLVAGVLCGIWFGFFTPTEGAGVGAAMALVLGLGKGLRGREIFDTILSVGRTSAPLLLLLVSAQLYSRVLSMTGLTGAAKALLLGTGLSAYEILAVMVLLWFVLGCIIDSISIILITVPVFAPIAADLGFDPLAFAILGILAVETGLLTPPFGILAFTVKAALPDEPLSIGDVFRGSVAYWVALIAVIVIIAVFPGIATFLPAFGR